MSKQERRKRSRERQRAREQERAAAASPPGYAGGRIDGSGEVVRSDVVSAYSSEEKLDLNAAYGKVLSPPAEPPSLFITGPVQRAAPRSVIPASPVAKTAPSLSIIPQELIDSPIDDDFEPGEDDGEEDELDERVAGEQDEEDDQEDEDEDDGGEDEEGEEGEEGDDDEDSLDLEDAMLEVACGAIEQGGKLSWQELCAWLVATEIDDPRLALLVALLCEGDMKLTGERVLAVMTELEMGDLIAEARVAVAEEKAGESEPEERQVVRLTSKDIAAQAAAKLADAAVRQQADKRRPDRPVKASQLRKPSVSTGALNVGLRGPQR